MVDFPKFFKTAEELYDLWPALFNWAAGWSFTLLGIVATASWWMRGYKADAAEAGLRNQLNSQINELNIQIAGLNGEIAGLKGQIDVLLQRLALAADQQKASAEYAKKVESELAQVNAQAAKGADAKELQLTVKGIENSLGALINSNNQVTRTLTFPGRPAEFGATLKSE
jgi:TolA-binding protein